MSKGLKKASREIQLNLIKLENYQLTKKFTPTILIAIQLGKIQLSIKNCSRVYHCQKHFNPFFPLQPSHSLSVSFPCCFFIYFDCCIFKHEFNNNNNLCLYWENFSLYFLWLRGKRDNWKYFVSNWILIAFVFCCCRIDFF